MPVVKFTSNLKRFYPELTERKIHALYVSELINKIDHLYPGIKTYILDDQDSLRKHVNIFINNSMIRDRKSLQDKIGENDEVFIMQALSGG